MERLGISMEERRIFQSKARPMLVPEWFQFIMGGFWAAFVASGGSGGRRMHVSEEETTFRPTGSKHWDFVEWWRHMDIRTEEDFVRAREGDEMMAKFCRMEQIGLLDPSRDQKGEEGAYSADPFYEEWGWWREEGATNGRARTHDEELKAGDAREKATRQQRRDEEAEEGEAVAMEEEEEEREGRDADRESTSQDRWKRWKRKPSTSKFRRARSPARGAGKPTEEAVLPGTEGTKEVLTPEPTPDGRLKRKITSFGAGEGRKKWIVTMLIEEKNLEEAKRKLGEMMGEDYLIHVSPEEAGLYTLEANALTGSEGEGHHEEPGVGDNIVTVQVNTMGRVAGYLTGVDERVQHFGRLPEQAARIQERLMEAALQLGRERDPERWQGLADIQLEVRFKWVEEEGVRVWTVYVGNEEHGDAVTSLLFDMLGKKTDQGTRQRAAFGRSLELFEITEEVVLLTKSAREAADEGRRLDKAKKGKKGGIPAKNYDDTSIVYGVRANMGVDDLLGNIADRGKAIAEEVDPTTPAPEWMAEGEGAAGSTGKEEWLRRNQGYLRSMLVKSLMYPDGNGGSTIKIQWESKRVAAAMERHLWEVQGRWGDSAMTQRIRRAPKTWLTKDDVAGIRRKKQQAEARKKAGEGKARQSAARGSNGDGDWESFKIPKPRPPSPEKRERRGETPTPRPRPRPASNPRGGGEKVRPREKARVGNPILKRGRRKSKGEAKGEARLTRCERRCGRFCTSRQRRRRSASGCCRKSSMTSKPPGGRAKSVPSAGRAARSRSTRYWWGSKQWLMIIFMLICHESLISKIRHLFNLNLESRILNLERKTQIVRIRFCREKRKTKCLATMASPMWLMTWGRRE